MRTQENFSQAIKEAKEEGQGAREGEQEVFEKGGVNPECKRATVKPTLKEINN